MPSPRRNVIVTKKDDLIDGKVPRDLIVEMNANLKTIMSWLSEHSNEHRNIYALLDKHDERINKVEVSIGKIYGFTSALSAIIGAIVGAIMSYITKRI